MGEAARFYTELQGGGEIESFEAVLLEPHGGDLGGFFLVRGEREALARVRTSEDFGRVIVRATMVVQRVGVVAATTGAELARRLGEFQQHAAELAG